MLLVPLDQGTQGNKGRKGIGLIVTQYLCRQAEISDYIKIETFRTENFRQKNFGQKTFGRFLGNFGQKTFGQVRD